MGGGCTTPVGDKSAGCCDVSSQVSVGLQDVAVADVNHNKQILSLDASQPPPGIITAKLSIQLLNTSEVLLAYDFSITTSATGTRTYLVTQRFRV